MKKEDKGFIQGVALCAAVLCSSHDLPVQAKELLDLVWATKKILKNAGVSEYELKKLKKAKLI